ncbi:MAG: methyltransferase domain-containing protein [Sedimentisphaerales bacterium]|jgi:SAM-dependent methyltransferase
MEPLIKTDLNKIASGGKPVILDIGCGRHKRLGAIGIDKADLPGVDIVADIEEGLGFLPDSFADEIYTFSFLEHVQNFENLMCEIVRVLKKDGKAVVRVPHFSNPYYYSDPTHKRFFGLYSFYYFVENQHQMRRKVPDYYFPVKIRILSQKIIFDSPFLFGKIIKRLLQILFNLGTFIQEFYEENLCYMLPCSALEITFTKENLENG